MAGTGFQPLQFKSEEGGQRGRYDWLADLGDEAPAAAEFQPGLEAPADQAGPSETEAAPAHSLPGSREELERLREEARREGYEKGLLEGREKGEEEGREAMERVQATFLDSFEHALKTLTEGQPEIATDWAQPLEDLTRGICERVLRKALDEELAGYLQRLVEAGLEALESAGELRVTLGDVTPGLVDELRERLQQHAGVATLRLHMETDKPADFVRIETDYGVIQTTLDSQLDRVAAEAGAALGGS
jgi:flagellar biosynthesis/type III secretory pathway protein FliH